MVSRASPSISICVITSYSIHYTKLYEAVLNIGGIANLSILPADPELPITGKSPVVRRFPMVPGIDLRNNFV